MSDVLVELALPRTDAGAFVQALEENVVLANSPPLAPRPVKSKRSTPMPSSTSPRLMRDAAAMSFERVKQCANNAKATGS